MSAQPPEQDSHDIIRLGGTARMIVSFADGHETTLDLSELA